MNSVGLIIFSPTLILHHYSPTESNGITLDFPWFIDIKIQTPISRTYIKNNNGCEMSHLGTVQQKENRKCLRVKILLLLKPIMKPNSCLPGVAEVSVQHVTVSLILPGPGDQIYWMSWEKVEANVTAYTLRKAEHKDKWD